MNDFPQLFQVEDTSWGQDHTKPDVLAFDTESLDLGPRSPATHLSWAMAPDVGYVARWDQIPVRVWEWLADRDVTTVAHNMKHDWLVCKYHYSRARDLPYHEEFVLRKPRDTRILRHLLDQSKVTAETLKLQARAIGMPHWTSPLDRWQAQGGDWPPPEEILLPYSACDAVATWRLYQACMDQLPQESLNLYVMLCNATESFVEMEYNGLHVDVALLQEQQTTLQDAQRSHESAFQRLSGVENPRSPKQLSEWLYGRSEGCLGLECPDTTRKGAQATGEATLEKLLPVLEELGVQNLPMEGAKVAIHHLLAYREAKKREEKVSGILNAQLDGVLHQVYNETGTDSGRTSSGSKVPPIPNVQNLERIGNGPLRYAIVSRFQ